MPGPEAGYLKDCTGTSDWNVIGTYGENSKEGDWAGLDLTQGFIPDQQGAVGGFVRGEAEI